MALKRLDKMSPNMKKALNGKCVMTISHKHLDEPTPEMMKYINTFYIGVPIVSIPQNKDDKPEEGSKNE